MKKIFEEVTLGNIKLKNRLIRSATHERGGCEKGVITPALMKIHEDLAKGGIGLTITGLMGVAPGTNLNPTAARIYADEFVPQFKEMAAKVHAAGAKIMVQIVAAGAKGTDIDTGDGPLAPSAHTLNKDFPARAMTGEEIKSLIPFFGKAAAKVKEAGADGVQIHGAHGFLINEFLSPLFNKRTDEYGGGIENRARPLFAIYDSVRAAVGKDYPVWMKINYNDFTDPGLTGAECEWVCAELAKKGLDAVEISSGAGIDNNSTPSRRMRDGDPEGYFMDGAMRIADILSIPVVSIGGHRTPQGIEQNLNRGKVQAVSLSRPLICEPGLAKRWQEGDTSKAKCVSCNKCFAVPSISCPIRATL